MKNIFVLLASIVIGLTSSFAQTPAAHPVDESRQPLPLSHTLTNQQIHRIGDYGKLWCILSLFHPEMAYNKINVDSLFLDNIYDLLKEPSAENFKMSIQKMIDRLNDPYTNIKRNKNANDSVQLPMRSLLTWLGDSTALVYFDDAFIKRNASDFTNIALSHLIDTLKQANSIVIDLRKSNVDENDYYSSDFMKRFISYITPQNIIYPSFRSRIHYGHESETFDMPFYYQGWLLQNGSVVYKKRNSIHKPFCLLINRFSTNVGDAIAAMQHNGIAKVVADDSLGNFDPTYTYPAILSDSLQVNVRLTEIVYSNGSKNFSPDVIIYPKDYKTQDSLLHIAVRLSKSGNEMKASSGPLVQNTFATGKVNGYDSLTYPPAPLRLLGLMRYWRAINYFCPNKDLITKNWDSVLYEYVPMFLAAKDSLDYVFSVAKLITEIHDGHGWIDSRVLWSIWAKVPPIQLKHVGNRTIVLDVLNDSLKNDISRGDEIVSVDGIPVQKLRDSLSKYIGASNNASLQRDVSKYLLAGKENTTVRINYLHKGIQRHSMFYRTKSRNEVAGARNKAATWKKLSEKVGYVDFGNLEVWQIDSMFTDLKSTDAIILDDRSYPKGTVWALIDYLSTKPVTGAKGTTMIADSPDPSSVTRQDQLWQLPVTPRQFQYKGKLIILVNETTMSQAEYSCMVLQAAYKKVTIIGSQTAGADGDVTGISIPGGIKTAFSGHGIHYPDGKPTQGIGIVPDIKVSPTIKGITEGKDEVLERAMEFARSGK